VGNALTEEEVRKKSVGNEKERKSEIEREKGADNGLMGAK